MNVELAKKVFGDLLDLSPEMLNACDTICININSIVSPLMHKKYHNNLKENNLYTDSYFEEIKLEILEIFSSQFINKYNHKRVVFYYKELGQSNILQTIYKSFRYREEIDEKSSLSRIIFRLFVSIARELSDKIPTVELYTTSEGEHTYIPRLIIMNSVDERRMLIVSRDHMDLLNAIDDRISVWNGRVLYNHKSTMVKNIVEPACITPVMLPIVLTISGDKKLGYRGIPSYGIKKTLNLLMDNGVSFWSTDIVDIKDKKLERIVNETYRYRCLFDIELYLELCRKNDVKCIEKAQL